ncbi:MAG TPA: TIGR04141 family sporadically distributed protein [Clostridiales bacterium]|nr:TIGR04141 family sporadically distributed protein [Clostridiales bacterium]
MAERKNDKPLYDYNIYRIFPEKVESFISFLKERGFENVPIKKESIRNHSGYNFTLMFCDKDNQRGSPWINLLNTCTERDLTTKLRIYGAALICHREDSCFVVSYGNAHFYLSNFCDYNFGISIAERLVDLDRVKAQQNISHGSKLSKMHMDYLGGTVLSYRSGEIPTYIRGTSLDPKWGATINCGTSAQFKWEEKPTEIGQKLDSLEKIIKDKCKVSLPRLTYLDPEEDAEKISELYHQLANAIEHYDDNIVNGNLINVPSFYVMGTKLIQNDSVRFRLSCNRKWANYDGELSIQTINDFIARKEICLHKDIQNINITIEYATDAWTSLKPITEYLEFITENNFCLRNGKWCSFNTAYLERIFEEVKKVEFENHDQDIFSLSKSDVIKFAQEKGIYKENDKRQSYETYYNLNIAELIEATCLHTLLMPIDSQESGKYRYEVCDFFKDQTLFFSKIGQPNDFAYAIDQALLTLDKCEANMSKLSLPGNLSITPKEFRLILIFNGRATKVKTWEDVLSINFLIHLTELKRRLSTAGISLKVDFVYW